jgi:murein DD-endopeptidase MepM/ murein hydrolase activator NlpD
MQKSNVGLKQKLTVLVMVSIGSVFLHAQPDSAYIPATAFYTDAWNEEYTIASHTLFDTSKVYEIPLLAHETDRFVFPCINTWNVISEYGWRGSRMHTGIDIKQQLGDTIVAAWGGRVRIARYLHAGYGNVVIIRHENGLETLYAHLSKVLAKPNCFLQAGQPIGLAGRTGRATTEHLHFEVRFLYRHFNPSILIDFKHRTGTLMGDTLWVSGNQFGLKNDTLWENPAMEHTLTTHPVQPSPEIEQRQERVTSVTVQSAPSKQSSHPRFHIVRKGDTLYSIARKYKIHIDTLYKINRLKEASILQIGQKIKLR